MKRVMMGLTILTVLTIGGGVDADIIYPGNNGFETPDQGVGGQTDQPSGASWTFSSASGIAANDGTSYGIGVIGATNGNSDGTTSTTGQAAFIQFGGGGSSISQQVILPTGFATVTFSIESRNNYGGNPLEVFLGTTQLGTTYLAASETSFNTITTSGVDLTAGTYTLSFVGTSSGGGVTSFVDNVSLTVNSVPEPSGLALLGLATIMFAGYYGWRRRKLVAA